MPELPEVETVKNGLQKKIVNKKITNVWVGKKKLIRSNLDKFAKTLKGSSFKKILRRGKLLIFEVKDKELFLLIHLKLTGQLIYSSKNDFIPGGHYFPPVTKDRLPAKWTHIIFEFRDGSKLFFNDLRQFGYFKLVSREEKEKELEKYGIEPLDQKFNLNKFKEIIGRRKGNIKALLLNQELIAGIGNIYADETCFYAKVKPDRTINNLSDKEIKDIFRGIKTILKKAVKYRGTTFSSYVDSRGKKGNFSRFLKVYKREKEKCLRCKKGTIEKTKVAGRGTRYCPVCQK